MCGITGVVGRSAQQKAFEGLKQLEYRGYDSWGIATLENSSFNLERHVGRIGASKLLFDSKTDIAIGHTRWATHGNVSERNAHPHLSNSGKIAIVHNGIVENFAQLKSELKLKGYTFKSDTDSEVIANLIEEKMKIAPFEQSVRAALLELEGNYAIAALCMGEKKIVCARNGSPLVLGIGKDEYFVASDATAFLEYTRNAVFLEDSSLATLSDGGVEVINVESGKKIRFSPKQLTWNADQAKKGQFEYFMLKEIYEQPTSILAAANQGEEKINELVKLMRSADSIYLAGCGSSLHACICGSYFFADISKFKATPILASEFSVHEPFFGKKTLVIGVSQSGETADLMGCLKAAKAKGAKIASIVNVMDSSVMRISDVSLLMNAGPEVCVLSTKSYTAQLAVFLLLAYALSGKITQGRELLRKASSCAKNAIPKLDNDMKLLAKKLSSSKNIFVIGRVEGFPSALEGALKIKEVSYIHAEGFAGGELKHGTIALIENGTPAIVLATPQSQSTIISNAIEMKSRGAQIIGIGSEKSDVYDTFVGINECAQADPIMLIIPVQLLAYHLALEKKLDPDKPRNLAKSVTVK